MEVGGMDSRQVNRHESQQWRLNGMHQALSLVECETPRELRLCCCDILRRDWGFEWVQCLYIDGDGRWLAIDDADARLDCDDFRHPFAHAIRQETGMTLALGEARSRLDHPDFQRDVAELPVHWRLRILPLRARDEHREWLGVLAIAGNAVFLDERLDSPDFHAFETLVCRLWAALSRRCGERSQRVHLQNSLAQLNTRDRRRSMCEQMAVDILGQSDAIQRLRHQVVRAAETNLAVLLQGETGTGKDRVARAIHRFSARGNGPFMAINCAAIPETLLESELFGHIRGAFSGADESREGLIAQADGGTLFLDEIGDMPLALQAKLLRVLESGRYRPLGAGEERRADMRLIAATHQPLRERIQDKRFRADLFYRLGQFPVTLPPLRERRGDIPELANAFVRDFCHREGREELTITSAALRQLRDRDYPGNVRELKNLIDYACAMSPPGEDIGPMALPGEGVSSESPLDAVTAETDTASVRDLRRAVREYEASVIRQRLLYYDGNRTLAAASLGVPKRTLAHKCQQMELDAK